MRRLVKTTHIRQHNERRAAATAAACAVDRHASRRAATHRHSNRWRRGGRHRYCRQRDGSAVLLVLVLLGAECGTQTAARSLLRVARTTQHIASTSQQTKISITSTHHHHHHHHHHDKQRTASASAPGSQNGTPPLASNTPCSTAWNCIAKHTATHNQTHTKRQTPLNHHRSTTNNLENYEQAAHASSSTACTRGQASARDVAHLRLGD
eukprot:COSAG06_NODE_7966_length_2312_cov_3.934205_1_plen_209_part_00